MAGTCLGASVALVLVAIAARIDARALTEVCSPQGPTVGLFEKCAGRDFRSSRCCPPESTCTPQPYSAGGDAPAYSYCLPSNILSGGAYQGLAHDIVAATETNSAFVIMLPGLNQNSSSMEELFLKSLGGWTGNGSLRNAEHITFIFLSPPKMKLSRFAFNTFAFINISEVTWAWWNFHEPSDIEKMYGISHIRSARDTALSRRYIHSVINHLVGTGVPASRIMLYGFSQGAVMALEAGLSYPEKLAGVVSASPVWSPPRFTPTHKDLPVFLGGTNNDELARLYVVQLAARLLNNETIDPATGKPVSPYSTSQSSVPVPFLLPGLGMTNVEYKIYDAPLDSWYQYIWYHVIVPDEARDTLKFIVKQLPKL